MTRASPRSADAVAAHTAQVLKSFAGTPDPRLREILTTVTAALHGAIADLQLTSDEWAFAVRYLTAVGHACTDVRQEFILLSDVLGVSMLVETIADARQDDAVTRSTVLGPFHVTASPDRELGESIDLVGSGPALMVRGRVRNDRGNPVTGALVDVWQSDENGFYDVQLPDDQPAGNGRGLFRTDADGGFWFRTVVPAPYPIPTDGPVGALLRATRRHPYRPAHIHVRVAAVGYRDLVTHLFIGGSAYLDSDAVFAVKDSLVCELTENADPGAASALGLPSPFRETAVDLVVATQGEQSTAG